MNSVLIIDDEGQVRKGLSRILTAKGFMPREAPSGTAGLELFARERPDIVLLDLRMPDMDGMEVLLKIKTLDPGVPVIFLTAHGDISTAVKAMRQGAYDFIAKPPDVDMLLMAMKRACEKLELERKLERLNTVIDNSLEGMLGRSENMKRLVGQLEKVASSDFSIILQGETGTGKTFVAKIIHDLSKRAQKPFIKVDIGALPETLVESELFGHEKGAFTGAERKKKGFFELADKGTLFIDELQNISPYIQGKLLSSLEEKTIQPLGSDVPVKIDIRVIAATNGDIRKSVGNKSFREDLFYRLSDFTMVLPPLRERPEDISFFTRKFIDEVCGIMGKSGMGISGDALKLLSGYAWPGNIRELRSVIRRAVLFSEGGELTSEHIRFSPDDAFRTKEMGSVKSLKEIAREAEKRAILDTLTVTSGNKTKAAALLRITYRSLLMKIKDYGLA